MFQIRLLLLIFGIVSVCVFSSEAQGRLHFRRQVRGKIIPEFRMDTLIIKYDVIILDATCDSINLALGNRPKRNKGALAQPLTMMSLQPKPAEVSQHPSESRWQGELRWPEPCHETPKHYSLYIYETSEDSNSIDTAIVFDNLGLASAGYGRQVSMGPAWFSRGGFNAPVRSDAHGISLYVEDDVGYIHRNFCLFAGYTINHSSHYTFYQYLRVGGKLSPWGSEKWRPSFRAALSYSRVKAFVDPTEVVKKGFGAEVGVRLDGPFEGFRYSYNTAVEGYHRVDISMSLIGSAAGPGGVGTRYSLYNGDYVSGFGVYVYMEGYGGDALHYYNNRPFWHKGLAVVGFIPWLPVILLMSIME